MRSFLYAGVLIIAASVSAQAEVLIGVAGPMTGANAWPGEQMQRGAERRWQTSMLPVASSATKCDS